MGYSFAVDPMNPAGPKVLGRYALYDEIACGGMASVHLGRLLGPVGFSRTVAIKRLHPQFARDPEFVSMFLDEARLAARIRHPNVVPTLDVIAIEGELLVVMEYVQGESFSRLLRVCRQSGTRIPIRVVASIVTEMLAGLHAAHEARSERGEPLGIVHRDVSPQNVLVGIDGVARVVDFGVAKAVGRIQVTRDGQLKGKLPYMAPEQLTSHPVDRRTDVYAAAVVLWEALTGRRLFDGSDAELMYRVLEAQVAPPSHVAPGLPAELDAIVMRGLARDPNRRWPTAMAMADAMDRIVMPSTAREVGRWVTQAAAEVLAARAAKVAEVESRSSHPMDLPTASPTVGPRVAAAAEEPHTLSSASVASSQLAPPRPPSSRWLLATGAAAVMIAVPVAILLGMRWRNQSAARAQAAPSPSASLQAPSTQPDELQASERASGPVEADAQVVASSAASSTPPEAESASTAAASTSVPRTTVRPKSTATAKTKSSSPAQGKRTDDFGF